MFNIFKLKKELKELRKSLWSLDELFLALEWKTEGKYLDWYYEKKLTSIIPKKLFLKKLDYIGQRESYSTSILKNRKY